MLSFFSLFLFQHHHLLHPQGEGRHLLLPLLIAQALLLLLPGEGGLLPHHLQELPQLHLPLRLLPGLVLLFLHPLQTGCTLRHHQPCPLQHLQAHHHLHLCQGPQHHHLLPHLRLHQGHLLPLACLLMVTIKFPLLPETKQLFWIKLERVLSLKRWSRTVGPRPAQEGMRF